MEHLSFRPNKENIKEIDKFIERGIYPSKGAAINTALTLLIKTHNTNRIIDFLQFVFPGVIFFLGCIGATLFLRSLFFFVLSGISGLYLMVFIYLFYDKYKGVKNKHANSIK